MRFSYGDASVHNAIPRRIVFGAGCVQAVPAEAERLGARRALVVTTPGRAGMAKAVVEALGGRCAGLLATAVSQVPIELARIARQQARDAKADCLVSVGGGAAIGLGKAIALETEMPIVAVPTTYSGSEMTGFCGITIEGVKRMHQSPAMLASTVIYDPALSRSLPRPVSAASAMNALAHCVDASYAPSASPINVAGGIEGAGVISRALPALMKDPTDMAARTAMLYGAYLGGGALAAGFALQHGIAHVLGGSFGIEHGLAHAVVLPFVTAYNARYAPDAMRRLAGAMGVSDAAAGIYDLLEAANLPTSLASLGITLDQLDSIVQITIETDHGNNPGPVDESGVRGILAAAFDGMRPHC